jgi:uncharacterized protein YndB with AHSA1/START domain
MPMSDMSKTTDRLILEGRFTAFTPDELFQHWTNPELLTLWWPEAAEVESREQGRYRLTWPTMGWELTGVYTEFIPGQRLSFTWQWTHEPEAQREVTLSFSGLPEGGTWLTIVHGLYGPSDQDQDQRRGHREGWIHFCMRLAGLREGTLD